MTRAKKVLLILFIIFAVIGCGFFWLYNTLGQVQTELNAVVEPMIKDMSAENWSKAVIDKYASDALKDWLVENKMDNGMSGLSVLGEFKEYKGLNGFNASSDSASLVSIVEFDSGNATVTLKLSKHNGAWLLDSFIVDSPVLLNNNQSNAE